MPRTGLKGRPGLFLNVQGNQKKTESGGGGEAALTVPCSASAEPTAITSPAGHLDVTVGESIVLPCQVSHDPTLELKFTWFFNEQLIHFGNHWAFFEKVGGVSDVTAPQLLQQRQKPVDGKLRFCVLSVSHNALRVSNDLDMMKSLLRLTLASVSRCWFRSTAACKYNKSCCCASFNSLK